ncbi:MAG: GNAT family N-acetyltransferase [Muribaculaceae bacterium]|nr:GNAT family N-acetyltransferase [Muribaculaceae bacterium]MBR1725756.1 GNAT family N-acetyltransferase [Muribaculaceae bacterium]
MIEIVRYTPEMRADWDDLVAGARNGNMLHLRNFMDYHSDRFADHSLVAMRSGAPMAVLPANEDGGTLWSHQGLTYGSWIMPSRHIDPSVMLDVMEQTVAYLRHNGFNRLVYKPVPHIYHRYPAEDDLYALWRCGGRLLECGISSTIDLTNRLPLDRGCRSASNSAHRSGVEVSRSQDWAAYWQVLTQVLADRHDTRPVHTLDEIQLLVKRFPDRIRLFSATVQDEIVAGVVMFELGPVAHAQYIAASPRGRELKALTRLFDWLIDHYAEREFRYLDFGISTEQHGTVLNRGLVQQKCRLGGRGILYPIYEITL